MRWLIIVLLASGCAKNLCEERALVGGDPRVQVVGDSVLAWNAEICQSVADHLAFELDTAVENHAVNGARITGSIPSQYEPGDWDVVVIDGGGNDVNGRCACGACDGVIDQVDTARRALVERALDDGAEVLLIGYYGVHPGAWYGFERCENALFVVDEQARALAEELEGVTFVDLERSMTHEVTPELYDFDAVHPNPEGAVVLGRALARALNRDR